MSFRGNDGWNSEGNRTINTTIGIMNVQYHPIESSHGNVPGCIAASAEAGCVKGFPDQPRPVYGIAVSIQQDPHIS